MGGSLNRSANVRPACWRPPAGLLFTGKLTGEFIALDENTGNNALAVQDWL